MNDIKLTRNPSSLTIEPNRIVTIRHNRRETPRSYTVERGRRLAALVIEMGWQRVTRGDLVIYRGWM